MVKRPVTVTSSSLRGFVLQAFVLDVWMLCVVLIPMTVGLTLVNVVITSAMTNCVAHADTGRCTSVGIDTDRIT